MGEVEEVDKNAEFRSNIRPHLLWFVYIVVYIILRNLYKKPTNLHNKSQQIKLLYD